MQVKSFVALILFLVFLSFTVRGQAQDLKLILPNGNNGSITKAGFSNDASRIFTADGWSFVKLWDAETGLLLLTLKGDYHSVLDAAFSPDGRFEVTFGSTPTQLFNAKTGALICRLKNGMHVDDYKVIFSKDGKKIATISFDETTKIWDASTGALITILKKDTSNTAVFSNDGKVIITGSMNHPTKFWDAKSGVLLHVLKDKTFKLGVTTDGKNLLTAYPGLMVWNYMSLKSVRKLGLNQYDLTNAFFSNDGKKVVSVSTFGGTDIWDVASGKLILNIPGEYMNTVVLSPDGTKLITDSKDSCFRVWNTRTGKLLFNFPADGKYVYTASFSIDGKKIIAGLEEKAKVWDADNGNLLLNLKGSLWDINAAQYSNSGKHMLTRSRENHAEVWNSGSGLQISDINIAEGYFSAVFSPDETKLLTLGRYMVKLWDVPTGKLLGNTPKLSRDLVSAGFTTDGNKITLYFYGDSIPYLWNLKSDSIVKKKVGLDDMPNVAYAPYGYPITGFSEDGTGWIRDNRNGNLLLTLANCNGGINSLDLSPDHHKLLTIAVAPPKIFGTLWDTKTGKLLDTLESIHRWVEEAKFSYDGASIVGIMDDHTAKIWDANTGKLKLTIPCEDWHFLTTELSPDGKNVLTASSDNAAKIWDARTGELINTFFSVDSANYFNQIPSGYYMCTPNAAKLLHYVTKDLDVITFEQLDIKYNRPDLVLGHIGCTDTALIHAYHRAYEKRIQKLGIDTLFFKDGYSAPQLKYNSIGQMSNLLRIHIQATDKVYPLNRFNLWVNKVPVYGSRGMSLKKNNKTTFDTTVTVKLSNGENQVEASVTNANGTESYHQPIFFKNTVIDQDTLVHFIGIGIDKFKENQHHLNFSVSDIRQLALNFKKRYGNKCQIDTLFNTEVTLSKVRLLKRELLKSGINDRVVIAYSGHGLLDKKFDYYLSSYNVSFKDPSQAGIPYETLENLLDSIPARKKLMLIDACYSGEVDTDYTDRSALITSLVSDTSETGYSGKDGLSIGSSFELMKQLFVYVGKSTGSTIISASGGLQSATESRSSGHGYFTQSVLEEMNSEQHVSISSLKSYVYKRVPELSAGEQVPTSRNETDTIAWQLW